MVSGVGLSACVVRNMDFYCFAHPMAKKKGKVGDSIEEKNDGNGTDGP